MNSLSLLLVEDDPDDIELMNEALKGARIVCSIQTISQGDKVLPYLELCKKFPYNIGFKPPKTSWTRCVAAN